MIRFKDDSIKKRNTTNRHIQNNTDKWALGKASSSSVLKPVSSSTPGKPITNITLVLKVPPRVTYVSKSFEANVSVPYTPKSKETPKIEYKNRIYTA